MGKEFYEIGDFLQGMYPRYNIEGMQTRKRIKRTFQLTEIRDLNVCPLEAQTLEATPTICRSDILLKGIDLDSGEQRSFYLASFEGLEKISPQDIKAKPPQVLVLHKGGGMIKTEDFSDADRSIFCDYFNARSENCVAVPRG